MNNYYNYYNYYYHYYHYYHYYYYYYCCCYNYYHYCYYYSVVMKVELARLVSMIRSNLHCYHQMHLQSCKYRGPFVALYCCYSQIQSPTYRCLKDLLQITYVGHCK